MKLSACIIAKNESVLLDRCLKSLNGVAEIIVIDTGSADNTVELAKKYTDKVYTDYTWADDFATARNHALSKATGDWVLSIDADEVCLTPITDIRKSTHSCIRSNVLGQPKNCPF